MCDPEPRCARLAFPAAAAVAGGTECRAISGAAGVTRRRTCVAR